MQQRSNLYIFTFALIVCLACSIGLALAATALKPAQVTNSRLDVVKNLLSISGYKDEDIARMTAPAMLELYRKEFPSQILNENNKPVERAWIEKELAILGYPPEDLKDQFDFEIVEIFNKKINLIARRAGQSAADYRTKFATGKAGYRMIFMHKPAEEVDAYIIPIAGNGLWGMMYGYLALQPDLITIKGVRFYKHVETPGLGAEAEKPWFTNMFIGKKILDENGQLRPVRVAKGKAASDAEVDGISGATLTGDGITKFIKKDLSAFEPYFQILRKLHTEDGV